MLDAFVLRLRGVRHKSGGGRLARCPSHDDRQASLSVDIGDHGGIVLKCMAGCQTSDVVRAMGLTMADLAPQTRDTTPVTVESLAASKALPVEALKRYGVKTVRAMSPTERLEHGIGRADGVWIPYHNPDGTITGRTRLRTAHVAKDGSTWLGSFGAILPYGLHDLADAREQGQVCICEGESDYWTLRHADIPALAIPGSQMVRALQPDHLAGISSVFVCQDSDPAGASFVSSIRQHISKWGIETVCAVPMPDGCKDVNDLYRRDPKGFADRLVGLIAKAAAVGAPPPREFSTTGDIYRLTAPEFGLRIELDQIRRSSWGALTGELLIASEAVGDVFCGMVNVSDADKWSRVSDQLQRRFGALGIDWGEILREFAIASQKADKAGKPPVWLQDAPPKDQDAVFAIDGVELPRHHPSCLFGDGGTGKSYIALYWAGCLTRQGVPCAYIDAELDASEHKDRLYRLYGETFPNVLYLRLDRALERAVEQIKRLVRDYKIEFLVLDSVGVMTQGAPESAEAANGYIRALRQIGVGSLSIAHVTKNGEHNDQKPFGSVFYHNGFRSTWYAEQADPDANEGQPLAIGLYNRKSNLSKRLPPVGLEIDFQPNHTHIRPVDIGTLADLSHKQPLWKQLEAALRGGPQSASDLAESLGMTVNAVRVTLARGKQKGRFTNAGRDLWGLN